MLKKVGFFFLATLIPALAAAEVGSYIPVDLKTFSRSADVSKESILQIAAEALMSYDYANFPDFDDVMNKLNKAYQRRSETGYIIFLAPYVIKLPSELFTFEYVYPLIKSHNCAPFKMVLPHIYYPLKKDTLELGLLKYDTVQIFEKIKNYSLWNVLHMALEGNQKSLNIVRCFGKALAQFQQNTRQSLEKSACHGDLNSPNILVTHSSQSGKTATFALIDLGGYCIDYFFTDPFEFIYIAASQLTKPNFSILINAFFESYIQNLPLDRREVIKSYFVENRAYRKSKLYDIDKHNKSKNDAAITEINETVQRICAS